jgi:serine/threonine-protein kinase
MTETPTSTIPDADRLFAGRYRLEGKLGEGGMGVVFCAFDTAFERHVAIKVVQSDPAAEKAAAQRFLREAKIAAKLQHEHIVEVFDLGNNEAGELFFVMELLDGESLGARLRREDRFAPARAVAIAVDICEALEVAHARGVVHRDLKPANVMLIQRGRSGDFVKLIDFGISKSTTMVSHLTGAGHLLGTLGYVAPEQIANGPVDGRADIYSLGVILYRMLSGRTVFDDRSAVGALFDHLQAVPEPMRVRAPEVGVPRALDEVVMRCLEKRPEARWASVGELASALQGALRAPHGPTVATVEPAPVAPAPAVDPPIPPAPAVANEPSSAPRQPLAFRRCPSCTAVNLARAEVCASCDAPMPAIDPPPRPARPAAPRPSRPNADAAAPRPPEVDLVLTAVTSIPHATWGRVARWGVVGLLLVNAGLTGFSLFSMILLVVGGLAVAGWWLVSLRA